MNSIRSVNLPIPRATCTLAVVLPSPPWAWLALLQPNNMNQLSGGTFVASCRRQSRRGGKSGLWRPNISKYVQ